MSPLGNWQCKPIICNEGDWGEYHSLELIEHGKSLQWAKNHAIHKPSQDIKSSRIFLHYSSHIHDNELLFRRYSPGIYIIKSQEWISWIRSSRTFNWNNLRNVSIEKIWGYSSRYQTRKLIF